MTIKFYLKLYALKLMEKSNESKESLQDYVLYIFQIYSSSSY